MSMCVQSNPSYSSNSSCSSSAISGKCKPFRRKNRISYSGSIQSHGAIVSSPKGYLREGQSLARRTRSVASTTALEKKAPFHFARQRSCIIISASSWSNEEWEDITFVRPPLSLLVDLKGDVRNTTQVKASNAPAKKSKSKQVRFSYSNDTTEFETSASDVKAAWLKDDISRKLQNFQQIYRHQGMTCHYPQSAHGHRSKACMVRLEPSQVISEIVRNREEHRLAVLNEQARQKEAGVVDADALMKVSSSLSERCVELASSSWWLERMKYRI